MKQWIPLTLLLTLCACAPEPVNPIVTRAPMTDIADYGGVPEESLLQTIDIAFTGKVVGIQTKMRDADAKEFRDFVRDVQTVASELPRGPSQFTDEQARHLGSSLYTFYEIEIDRVYYGEYTEPTITIAQKGGIVNGVQYVNHTYVPIDFQHSYLFLARLPPDWQEAFIPSPISTIFDLDPEIREQNSLGSIPYERVLQIITSPPN